MTAPYLLPAGKELGVPAYKTVIAYAWGDMMTDMIQPFWAIAMLAVAKLNFEISWATLWSFSWSTLSSLPLHFCYYLYSNAIR